jgi:hypothetical protein
MILADSILQTASMARCVSVAVTATDHTIFTPRVQAEGRRGSDPIWFGENEPLPAPRTGGLYKCHQEGWLCRGLSVPFTENVLGEPCSPGRRGHVSILILGQMSCGPNI